MSGFPSRLRWRSGRKRIEAKHRSEGSDRRCTAELRGLTAVGDMDGARFRIQQSATPEGIPANFGILYALACK